MLNLRDQMIRQLSDQRAAAVESLLSQWTALGHSDHLADISRVFDDGIPWNLERYQCSRDGAAIDLQTDYGMGDDNMLRMNVTPICFWAAIYSTTA